MTGIKSAKEAFIMEIREADVLIIGSGIAGLFTAELLSDKKKIVIVTKGNLENSNSILAQGGIAAAIDDNDNWKNHFNDTIIAGNYHNNEEATEVLVRNGPKAIQQLLDLGVPFDKTNLDNLALGREGGHHQRRIVHAGGDSTGKEIIKTLINKVKNKVTIYENEMTYNLLINDGQCVGAITRDQNGNGFIYKAKHIVLATGGVGGLYSLTSNDSTITGDGLALAYRAGVELVDLEFVQFHPTMLVNNGIGYGLVSEAVRGEGAKLIDSKGLYIMEGIHQLKDLAPRDIVSRRIFEVLQSGEKVFLDISMIANFSKRFPTITKLCEENNIKIDNGLLPVSPGAHFLMGGIKTNINGETNIKNLYAIGENSATGVHGANRLASNSLLEGVVFANRLTEYILSKPSISLILPEIAFVNKQLILPEVKEIQSIMDNNVGITRSQTSLSTAINWFEQFQTYRAENILFDIPIEQMVKINMLTTGWLITTSALLRTESRGSHYRSDYPTFNNEKWLKRYIIRRRGTNESDKIENAITATIC